MTKFINFSRGGKEGAVSNCGPCRGSGRRFITRQVAPGMIQQMQAQCDSCNGEGRQKFLIKIFY